MKKYFTSLLLLAIFFSFLSVANAQTAAVTTQTQTTPVTTTLRTQITDAKVTNLITRADSEITRRITALNSISGKLTGIKHLTDAQKTSFSSQIATEIANLTALKTKVDADTDITTLKTDVQSIVTSYRVFALFIPQIHMIAAADRVLNITETMDDFATKLAGRITLAQNAGQNITTLQALLTDMQKNIADAKTQANSVITTISGLTPAGYPGNQSDLQSGRKMLQTARLDLVAALQDGKKIIAALKELKPVETSPASSSGALVSPTSLPRPTSGI